MTLIKSISGIRGTIGGKFGDNLTPIDAVNFGCAYGQWIINRNPDKKPTVVIGRDARISGQMIQNFVQNSLISLGINVIDLDLSTTPTVELMVKEHDAEGGIIITASHNPTEWNALKLLDENGEFLNSDEGEKIIKISESKNFIFSNVHELGKVIKSYDSMKKHIDSVLDLSLVDVEKIKAKKIKVVVDAVNSTGGIIVPDFLKELNIEVIKLYCEPNGDFPHNPEPLKKNLTELSKMVVECNADLGIAVDPDVDRLVFVCEDGELFGEENTLVACADYVLSKTPGSTVSNLSSSRALNDISKKHNQSHFYSAVGEVNVVDKMKECNAIIGGEGNGGVIYPESHYGRDSIVGIGLFLSLYVERGLVASKLLETYPKYFMIKEKINLSASLNVDNILNQIAEKYKNEKIDLVDGVRIDFKDSWVQLRKSNTEPIIRIYSEAKSVENALELIKEIEILIKNIIS
ncbi:MAG: phosphoglucosamine mutase [Flavobacteriaceae bacterium TMED238]|nr:phosphoglucosamine mutase [Flavobacteriaceae bacterium]RPG61428.1 MAG: phosphoglucosamine mutase [Flavobacteriaceae bacterium TMED238]RZP08352.1 MAG: phosphoglucosamine mutase [Flavobacteriales bacterium]|tara:strand:+ start:1517 stop:2902 length:1386 start_codon:yes stop_codon:yes gene_type:complete